VKVGRLAAFALVVGVIGGFTAGQAAPVPTVVHPVPPSVAPPVTATPLTPPARVLLVGDSILRQAGPALARTFGHGATVRNAAVNGSGLLTPRFFDWAAQLDEELARATPDLVVVSFIGNYTGDPAGLWRTSDGEVVESIEDPAFAPEWARQTDAVLADLAPTGAAVVLVLPPSIPVPAVQAVVDRLRVVYQDAAARWPFVTLVDAMAVLDDPGDRAADGVHLSDGGAQALAAAIAAAS
jgi:hypothetical protein